MKSQSLLTKTNYLNTPLLLVLYILFWPTAGSGIEDKPLVIEKFDRAPSPKETINLDEIPYKIIYESLRWTQGRENWELIVMDANGLNQTNITNTPNLQEMYPHVSPDGTKVVFVVDEGFGRQRSRNVYYMNIDGTERVKVADNGRQPCWSPDSKSIAYLKGEYSRYSDRVYATAELTMYDLETKRHRDHPYTQLHHMYAIVWAPNAEWFMGVIHGGMEFSDNILAFRTNGTKLFDMLKWGMKGCRPDIRYDGKKLAWGETDWELCIGDIDFNAEEPTLTNIQYFVGCDRDNKVYHVDFSPDGKYIAFSYGPSFGGQQVGGRAEGWNICVTDLSGKWVQITTDGLHNKEPDWIPIPTEKTPVAQTQTTTEIPN